MVETKQKRKFQVSKGIPLKSFETMTLAQIRELDKQYRRIIKGGKQ